MELRRYWSLPARIAWTISSCVSPSSFRAVLSLSVQLVGQWRIR